jgi:hypothetical protein
MNVGNHVELRARDLMAAKEAVGEHYDFKCFDSKLRENETYTAWKATLFGEMQGYSFYVFVWDGKVSSSSLS